MREGDDNQDPLRAADTSEPGDYKVRSGGESTQEGEQVKISDQGVSV